MVLTLEFRVLRSCGCHHFVKKKTGEPVFHSCHGVMFATKS